MPRILGIEHTRVNCHVRVRQIFCLTREFRLDGSGIDLDLVDEIVRAVSARDVSRKVIDFAGLVYQRK